MELFKKRKKYHAPADTVTPLGVAASTAPEFKVEPLPSTSVQVISGASVQSLDLAGLQVSQAREVVRHILRLDQNTAVLVNGEPRRDDFRLTSGDTLEFVHHAGEKGASDGISH
jgi:hypothetical protein